MEFIRAARAGCLIAKQSQALLVSVNIWLGHLCKLIKGSRRRLEPTADDGLRRWSMEWRKLWKPT